MNIMKTLQKIISLIQRFPVSTLSLIVILLGATIYLCFRNSQLSSQLSRYQPQTNSSVTVQTQIRGSDGKEAVHNTLIESTDAEFNSVPAYTGKLMPSRILYWDSNISAAGSTAVGDSYKTDSQNPNPELTSGLGSFYFRDFGIISRPSWSPSQDSLVQLLMDRKILQLSFYNRGADKYLSKTYDLDFDRYQYNWTPSIGLTYQKKSMLDLVPYVQLDYKAFTRTLSMGTGISFKTRKIDYNIGFSLTRDPMIDQRIRPDLEISATYKFKKWQR